MYDFRHLYITPKLRGSWNIMLWHLSIFEDLVLNSSWSFLLLLLLVCCFIDVFTTYLLCRSTLWPRTCQLILQCMISLQKKSVQIKKIHRRTNCWLFNRTYIIYIDNLEPIFLNQWSHDRKENPVISFQLFQNIYN